MRNLAVSFREWLDHPVTQGVIAAAAVTGVLRCFESVYRRLDDIETELRWHVAARHPSRTLRPVPSA